MSGDSVDEVAKVATCRRQDDGTKQIDEDYESHRKAAEATEILEPHEFR